MNANEMLIHGFAATLNQFVTTAVAEAVKPLQARIYAMENVGYLDLMEIAAKKATDPLQNRIIALEIQQSMGKAVFTLPDVDFNEAVRNVLDGYNFINRNDVVVLVEEAIGNHDFSDIDISGAVEEGIENYDFSNIIEENMPDPMSEDMVQGMIDDALGSLVVVRT